MKNKVNKNCKWKNLSCIKLLMNHKILRYTVLFCIYASEISIEIHHTKIFEVTSNGRERGGMTQYFFPLGKKTLSFFNTKINKSDYISKTKNRTKKNPVCKK